MSRTIRARCLLVATLAWPRLLPASPTDLEPLEQGMRLYDVRRYPEAIAAFQRGYAERPDPRYLFALGQAYRLGGDCRGAVESYRAYLRTNPLPNRVEVTNRLIELCAEGPSPPDGSSPGRPASVLDPSPATTRAEGSRPAASTKRLGRRYAVTWAGLGLSLGALVSAAAVQGAAHARFVDLRDSCAPSSGGPGCAESQIAGVERQQQAALGLWIAGGVLGLGTVIAAAIEARRR